MANRLATIREQVEHAREMHPNPMYNRNLLDKIYLLEAIDKLSADAGILQVALNEIAQKKVGQHRPDNPLWKHVDDIWMIAKNALKETGEKK